MPSNHLALERAHRLALLFLAILGLLAARLWYVAVVCSDSIQERALRPQFRSETIPAERGRIIDRFGLPLADNELCFEVAIRFGEIQQATLGHLAASGARTRCPEGVSSRAQYIRALGDEIAALTGTSPSRLRELIMKRAALTPAQSVAIAGGLSYSQFAALKLKAPRWPGLRVRPVHRRVYPLGNVGCHLVGHLGLVDAPGQSKAAREIRALQSLLEIEEQWEDRQALLDRLVEMQEAYRKRGDRVGRAGLEGQFERHLKGRAGIKRLEIDARGRSLRRVAADTRAPIAGRSLRLAISAELQRFAEALLAQSEHQREIALRRLGSPSPWIKGGAIVALDPMTAEVLALASTPTFSPADFAAQETPTSAKRRDRWLESPKHIGAIWDGLAPLEREIAGDDLRLQSEQQPLTWSRYLDLLSGGRDHLRNLVKKVGTVSEAYLLLRAFEELRAQYAPGDTRDLIEALYGGKSVAKSHVAPSQAPLKKSAASEICDTTLLSIPRNDHKLLLLDLLGLVIDPTRVQPELAACPFTLEEHRHFGQALLRVERRARQVLWEWYGTWPFARWRERCERFALAAARLTAERRSSLRPAWEILDREQHRQFEGFWRRYRLDLLAKLVSDCREAEPEGALAALAGVSGDTWSDDVRELRRAVATLAAQSQVSNLGVARGYLASFRRFAELTQPLYGRYPALGGGERHRRDLAGAFRARGGFGYMRSLGWRCATAQGSIFKLVVAYEALRERWFPGCRFDQINPLIIWDHVRQLSGRTAVGATAEGRPIWQIHKGGRLPKSSRKEIGKIDLIDAIKSSSNPYFSLLAAEVTPLEDLFQSMSDLGYGRLTGIDLQGEVPGSVPKDLDTNRTGLYNTAIGQHALTATPLQTARMLAALANGGQLLRPKVVASTGKVAECGVFLPLELRQALFEGMHRVAYDAGGCASAASIRSFPSNSPAMLAYRQLRGQFIGKTSTAEVDEWGSLAEQRPERCSNIWFGGISFDSAHKLWARPELVVVVFLRHGTYGKEAAPIAAHLAAKWREIKSAHSGLVPESTAKPMMVSR